MSRWRRYTRTLRRLGIVAPLLGTAASAAPDFREIRSPPQQVLVVDLGTMRNMAGIYSLKFYIATVDEPTTYVRSSIKLDCARRLAKIRAVTYSKPGEIKFSKAMHAPRGWKNADSDGMSKEIADLVCASPGNRDRYAVRMAQSDWRSAVAAALAMSR